METTGRWNALWKTLAEVLPNCIGPTAVLISVGINVLRGGLGGGSQFLSKLLQAGSIISIISRSMQSLTESRQQWKDLCVECKNIDRVLSRPDSEPLSRTPDGSLRLKNASFGWPIKPPTTYTVKAADTAITAVGQDATAPPPLQKGDVVESVDGQKKGRDQVRVRLRRADPAAPPSEEEKGAAQDGWVKVSALAKNPEAALADWPAPKLGVVDLDLCITQGELVLVSGPVAAGKSTLLQSLVGNTESLGEQRPPRQLVDPF
jgi:ABC-type multidrug transport system fused ATPase/permease subunit